MKTLKICLVILCLLPVLAVGLPQFSGAKLFMKTITIHSKKYGTKQVKIDNDDYEKVIKYRWRVNKVFTNDTQFYARADINGKTLGMHRFLMGSPIGLMVDHKNGDRLDNRKVNLRVSTGFQNQWNRTVSRKSPTGLKGVWVKDSSIRVAKYCSSIRVNGKRIFLGYFKTPMEAAFAYNSAAIKHHGEFAKINIL